MEKAKEIVINIKTYKEDLRRFEKSMENAMKVNEHLSGIKTSFQIKTCHNLFNKLIANCTSINRLCPYSKVIHAPFWDFFSIATLTRSLFENYAAFNYLVGKNCSDEERDFRVQLTVLHSDFEKYNFYKELNAGQEILEEFEIGLPERIDKIKSHPFFNKTPTDKRKRIIQGKMFMLKSYYEILKELNLDAPIPAFYRFYSNYTHSTAWSFMTMDNVRGRGIQNDAEVGHIAYALTFVEILLIRCTKEILELLPEAKLKINQKVLDYFFNDEKPQ